MIIRSLLDTDLYKFTMMQVVLHQFPGAQVEYTFNCRSAGADLVDVRPEFHALGAALEAVLDLRAREMVQHDLHHRELVQVGIEQRLDDHRRILPGLR